MTVRHEQITWYKAIRNDRALGDVLALQWLDEGEDEALRSSWLEIWNQIPYDEAFHARCRDRLSRCVPLARGLTQTRILSGQQVELALVYDPDAPETPWISLCDAMPALLWVRGGSSAEQTRRNLAPYLVKRPLSRIEAPCVMRYANPLPEVTDPKVIQDSIAGYELWLDDALWHSSFNDDPWRESDRNLSMLEQARVLEQVRGEHPDRFPSMSYRTLWSRSTLTIEQHGAGLWVFELRYADARDSAAIEQVNELTGLRLPKELPVDLAASLLRTPCVDAYRIEEAERAGEHPNFLFRFRAALDPSSPSVTRALNQVAETLRGDDDALAELAELAFAYQHDRFLFELALRSEGTLRKNLEAFLCQPLHAGGAS